jgi:hypothetical protein
LAIANDDLCADERLTAHRGHASGNRASGDALGGDAPWENDEEGGSRAH